MEQRICSWAAPLILVLFAVLSGGAAMRESATVDEVAHIGAGISYIQKLDLRLNPEHPPLGKVIAAAPLVIRGARADYSSPAWAASESFFPAYMAQWVFGDWVLGRWNDMQATLRWSRAPMLLLAVLLGALVYLYASRIGGPWGGLLCVSLYATAPVFIAFGPLVITDIPVTLFTLLALWVLGELWRNPSRRNAALFGLALAAALLSKFTAGILLVVMIVFAIQTRMRPLPVEPVENSERRVWRRARWRAMFIGIAYAAGAVYLFYAVLSFNQPDDAVNRIPWHPVRRLLMPGWLYVRGLMLMMVMSSRPTFLLGKSYSTGVPFYFPVVMVLKSPLGFLAIVLLGIAARFLYRRRTTSPAISEDMRIHWRVFVVAFAVFTCICLLSPLNISLRHFSMPLVLLILLLAPLPRMISKLRSRGAWQFATATLSLSCIWTAVAAYPYYIPFVNGLAFGRPVYAIVNDSNVDWNHGHFEVKRFAEKRGLRQINIDMLGLIDPAFVLPGAEVWDCQAPTARDAGRWSVVSATMIVENHNCRWLLKYPHEILAGGSMYAFQLPDPIPAPGLPGGPPDPSARKLLFGAPIDVRTTFLQLDRHPEEIAPTMDRMMREFEEQQKKGKQK
jgi:hypothetical protein